MAATVAFAFALPCREGWTPSSAETAVVIKAYGPLTRNPIKDNMAMLGARVAAVLATDVYLYANI